MSRADTLVMAGMLASARPRRNRHPDRATVPVEFCADDFFAKTGGTMVYSRQQRAERRAGAAMLADRRSGFG